MQPGWIVRLLRKEQLTKFRRHSRWAKKKHKDGQILSPHWRTWRFMGQKCLRFSKKYKMATKSFTFQHKFPIVLQAVSFSYASRLIKCTFFFTLQPTSIDFSNWDPLKIKVRCSPFYAAISFKMLIAGFQISRSIALLLCYCVPNEVWIFNRSGHSVPWFAL